MINVSGLTGNPHNLERTPGGSSGGEAALIAAGASLLGKNSKVGYIGYWVKGGGVQCLTGT